MKIKKQNTFVYGRISIPSGYRPERVMGEIRISLSEKNPLHFPSETTELTVKPTEVIPLKGRGEVRIDTP